MRPADLLECVRQMSIGDLMEMKKLLNPPTIASPTIGQLLGAATSPVTVDHFIQSKKACPNCDNPMMQSESHYRCWHCGNTENLEETETNEKPTTPIRT